MKNKSPPRLFFADRSGTSAIEFAIILPVFVAMLFAILAYGSYLSVVHGLQQITAEAARASVGGLTDAERADIARNSIGSNVTSYVFLTPQQLTLTSAATDPATNTFSVTVRYDASSLFVFSLPTIVPMPSPIIIRTASIQRGGY
jgi:Flp pilus assembly protein TadG